MTRQTSNRNLRAYRAPHRPVLRMTQPEAMKTTNYVYGVEKLNGHDAWALFKACAVGDMPKVKGLLAKERRLVNAQFWYQFPIHMAVREGYAEIVKLLLDHGADPGQSVYTYNSWDKLLQCAIERGHSQVESILKRAMKKRFNYTLDFNVLKEAIIARDSRKIGAVLRRQPKLAQSSDALGNNALHWSVITRQLGLIERFVDLGTPIDAQRADGQTPVLLAVNGATDYWYRATRGRTHPSIRNASVIVGDLLARGANYTISVAAAVGDQERAENRDRAAAQVFLDAGADINARGLEFHETPLAAAVRHEPWCSEEDRRGLAERRRRTVEFLLKRGAATNLPGDEPWATPLAWARKLGLADIEEVLVKHGAT